MDLSRLKTGRAIFLGMIFQMHLTPKKADEKYEKSEKCKTSQNPQSAVWTIVKKIMAQLET